VCERVGARPKPRPLECFDHDPPPDVHGVVVLVRVDPEPRASRAGDRRSSAGFPPRGRIGARGGTRGGRPATPPRRARVSASTVQRDARTSRLTGSRMRPSFEDPGSRLRVADAPGAPVHGDLQAGSPTCCVRPGDDVGLGGARLFAGQRRSPRIPIGSGKRSASLISLPDREASVPPLLVRPNHKGAPRTSRRCSGRTLSTSSTATKTPAEKRDDPW